MKIDLIRCYYNYINLGIKSVDFSNKEKICEQVIISLMLYVVFQEIELCFLQNLSYQKLKSNLVDL